MPNVLMATRRGWIEDKGTVLNALHRAQTEALRTPEWDRTFRLIEHGDDEFAVPPGRGPRYSLIEFTLFAGRTPDAKRNLYRAIVRNLGELGVPAEDIKIVLLEAPLENWGIRGGQAASDVDLGFDVMV